MMIDSPFRYHDGELQCDGVPLARIAAEVGTPVYVYSRSEWLRRAAAYRDAAAAYEGRALVCYTLKANANPALLRLVAGTGLGADVTGGGELYLALRAGFPPEKIVFSGVGKMAHEMAEALSARVKAIHVESEGELRVLGEVATELAKVAAVGVRLNPDVAAETHPHISTGTRAHKFGVAPDVALELLRQAADHPWLRPVSLSNHIGSQIVDLSPFAEAAQILVDVADEAAGMGIRLEYIDMGGGLGIRYDDERPPQPADLLETAARPILGAGYGLVMEPGRSIAGPTGALVARVLYNKQQGEKRFAIVDAAMNDLIRPVLYDAHHPILPVRQRAGEKETAADVVGPICETGDVLARERPLPETAEGDLLAILQVGAYGFAMSSNYNGRLRAAEVLVGDGRYEVIRRRQGYEALVDGCPETEAAG